MNDIEVVDLVKTVWRWVWLIIILVGVTVGLLLVQSMIAEDIYKSDVTMLIFTPDDEDITAMASDTFTDERDLVTTAINSFVKIAHYDEVKRRTQQELDLTDDYEVEVEAELGADFITIAVYSDKPETTQQIANEHTQQAIAYFGELRVLPSTEAVEFFSEKLEEAEQRLLEAQNTLMDFQAEHDIISLDAEITIAQNVLEDLELAYASYLLPAFGTNETVVVSQTDLLDARNSIEAQRARLTELNQLLPEYDRLRERVTSAQSTVARISDVVDEAELRASFAKQAMFIQIIQPAEIPDSPTSSTLQKLILGGAASLGIGIILSFFLDYMKQRW